MQASDTTCVTRELQRTVKALFEPDDVMELRMFLNGATFSGYFDDHDELIRRAAKYDERGADVYVTINELPEEIVSRRSNRTERIKGRAVTTSDKDVKRRRYLLIDTDPNRISGISSTDEEKRHSLDLITEIKTFLRTKGWTDPIIGDSGNGYHLLHRIDLPNDRDSHDLVAGVLEALDFKFSSATVKVDTTTKNAARITKFYGTTAKKGDDLPERPHRPSKLIDVPEDTTPVSRELLAEVAAMKPTQHKFKARANGHPEGWDVSAWISEHNVATKREGPWGDGGYRWILEACPWNAHTDNAAFIVRLPHGPIAAGCHHDSCRGFGWPELREHYEPGAYDRSKDFSAHSANNAKGDQNLNEEREPWAPPAEFHSYQLPEFPRDVFPPWMSEYTEALSEATQTSRDLAGMLGLTVAAVASAKLVQVEVWDGWTEPTNIFTATALRSGSRKTTVFERMCAPVEEYEALLIEETAAEIAEQRTRYRVYEGRLKKAEQRAAKSEGDDLDILTADAMQAAADLESIEVLEEPRLLIDDATPERIAAFLAEQGGRIALMSAEGGVFDMIAGRYSQGIPNLDVYLKGHAGDALRVDRVGRAPDFVKRPALTTGLAVQPDVLRGLASRLGLRGRGLLGRYLYAIPRNTEDRGGSLRRSTKSTR